MTIRVSLAALAVAAALSGCATTPEEQAATPAATPPSARPAPATSTSTGSATRAAVPPVAVPGSQAKAGQPDLKRSVYYEFDKYDVKPEYRALLQSHAAWLKANPQARITIEGNADEQGSREYNVALGQRRAESVVKQLVLLGAKPEQIEAVSWGEEKPRATGHDEKSWAENRRSDFAAK